MDDVEPPHQGGDHDADDAEDIARRRAAAVRALAPDRAARDGDGREDDADQRDEEGEQHAEDACHEGDGRLAGGVVDLDGDGGRGSRGGVRLRRGAALRDGNVLREQAHERVNAVFERLFGNRAVKPVEAVLAERFDPRLEVNISLRVAKTDEGRRGQESDALFPDRLAFVVDLPEAFLREEVLRDELDEVVGLAALVIRNESGHMYASSF